MFRVFARLRETGERPVKNLILLLFLIAIAASTTVSAQSITTQIRGIDAFVKTVDASTKRAKAPKLVFADLSDYESDGPAKWQRFTSEQALEQYREKNEAYTIAYVWIDGGEVASTNFTMFSPSGDWAKYIYSYFRPDGSLARVETDFRTFNGDFRVIRRRYFDIAGRELRSSVKFLDLQTRQPKKAPEGVMGDDPNEVDYYLTVGKLPFTHLLTKK